MPIEYQSWAPIADMPNRFLDAAMHIDAGGVCVDLIPFGDEAKLLRVRFSSVLAYAVYDDFAFAVGDIEYGLPGTPTFIVRNYDWPAPHKRYEECGLKDVTCYRFGSENAVVDVLASGSVSAKWTSSEG